jgi:ribosomal protein L40E
VILALFFFLYALVVFCLEPVQVEEQFCLALEYTPQDTVLNNKLTELQESLKPKIIAPPPPINPQELKEIPSEVLSDIDSHAIDYSKVPEQKLAGSTGKLSANKLLCPKCNTINSVDDAKCTKCHTPLSRFNRLKIKSHETIIELSNRLKTKDIVILIAITIVIIVSFPLARRENAIVVEPLQPTHQAILDPNKAEFQWDAITENIGFLLVIEKDGKKIIERYTNKLIYTLTYEELEMLEVDAVYKWQAIPISPKRVALNYRTMKLEFRVASKTKVLDQQ